MWRLAAAIVAVLLLLSGGAWLILARQSASMDMPATAAMSGEGGMPDQSRPAPPLLAALLTVHPGMSGVGPGLFLGLWVLMMIAMMFPTVAPMVLGYATIVRTREAGPGRWLRLASFVGGYLLAWGLVGLVALALNTAVTGYLGSMVPAAAMQVAGGLVIVAGGVYQFTAWKRTCLTHCRSTLSFFIHEWRPGVRGAVRMGTHHGAYCVGCCWGLMAVLFTVGLMNLAWMAILSVVIGVEKISPRGLLATRAVGATLTVAGVLIAVARIAG